MRNLKRARLMSAGVGGPATKQKVLMSQSQ